MEKQSGEPLKGASNGLRKNLLFFRVRQVACIRLNPCSVGSTGYGLQQPIFLRVGFAKVGRLV